MIMLKIGEWVDIKEGMPTNNNIEYVLTCAFDCLGKPNENSQRIVLDYCFILENGEFKSWSSRDKKYVGITNKNLKILAYATVTELKPYEVSIK